MLLVNAQQQVVGWFDRVKDMEKKEGDTVCKTKKEAVAAGFGDQWNELRPKKERAARVVREMTGDYTVVKGDKIRASEKAEGRDEIVSMLLNNTSFEDFFAAAEGKSITSPTGKNITPRRFASYALRRGFIEAA